MAHENINTKDLHTNRNVFKKNIIVVIKIGVIAVQVKKSLAVQPTVLPSAKPVSKYTPHSVNGC